MMNGSVASSEAAVVPESFGCAVANRFCQLLDDESDPFDILWEAERRQQRQQRQKRSEAGARRAGGGGGRREREGEHKQSGSPLAPGRLPQPEGEGACSVNSRVSSFDEKVLEQELVVVSNLPERGSMRGASFTSYLSKGQKKTPKRGEQQGFNNRGAGVKQDKTEWRTSCREYRSCETGRQAEFTAERNKNLARNLPYRPTERLDRERPPRGRGGGRGGMQGRGRGSGINRSLDDFDQRGKQEFRRQSRNDNTGTKADGKKSGGGACNWGAVKEKSGMKQSAPMEDTAGTSEKPGASEGEPLNKVAEGEPVEEIVQEMTLDEWKNLQKQNRPKPEFNIRKPASTVPSKAVVIHKSKYSKDRQKEYFEDDSHVFRRPVNDITSQLDINFGSLSRPGGGSRGARGGHGCGRRVEDARPRQEVQLAAPNPDDPEDFPALA